MGLQCGNPTALAQLKEGEVVVDLGAGGGLDVFLAAKRVGSSGKAIGVDMTPAMVQKARATAKRIGAHNVEFRLGEIEHLPLADNAVDVIISNCVLNLVSDKAQACREMYRVAKPGGRVAVSDVLLKVDALPADLVADIDALVGCVAGAAPKDKFVGMLEAAGFEQVEAIDGKSNLNVWKQGADEVQTCCTAVAPIVTDYDLNTMCGSYKITAVKPLK